MAVFLLVLKIIGYVLLALLALVLLIILVVLFAPIHYYAKAWKEEDTGGEAKVTWLLNFVKFVLPLDEGIDGLKGYIFWGKLPVYPGKEKKKPPEDFEDFGDMEMLPDEDAAKAAESSEGPGGELEKETVAEESGIKTEAAGSEASDEGEAAQEKDSGKKSKKKSKKKKHKKKHKKKKDALSKKIKKLRETFSEENIITYKKLLGEVIYILKKICPKKAEGYADYGFSSPDITGEILAVIAATPVIYRTDLKITPDFETEKTYAKGNVTISGKVRLYILVKVALDIVLDKNMREFVQSLL